MPEELKISESCESVSCFHLRRIISFGERFSLKFSLSKLLLWWLSSLCIILLPKIPFLMKLWLNMANWVDMCETSGKSHSSVKRQFILIYRMDPNFTHFLVILLTKEIRDYWVMICFCKLWPTCTKLRLWSFRSRINEYCRKRNIFKAVGKLCSRLKSALLLMILINWIISYNNLSWMMHFFDFFVLHMSLCSAGAKLGHSVWTECHIGIATL